MLTLLNPLYLCGRCIFHRCSWPLDWMCKKCSELMYFFFLLAHISAIPCHHSIMYLFKYLFTSTRYHYWTIPAHFCNIELELFNELIISIKWVFYLPDT